VGRFFSLEFSAAERRTLLLQACSTILDRAARVGQCPTDRAFVEKCLLHCDNGEKGQRDIRRAARAAPLSDFCQN
jgi:hypothetical protein